MDVTKILLGIKAHPRAVRKWFDAYWVGDTILTVGQDYNGIVYVTCGNGYFNTQDDRYEWFNNRWNHSYRGSHVSIQRSLLDADYNNIVPAIKKLPGCKHTLLAEYNRVYINDDSYIETYRGKDIDQLMLVDGKWSFTICKESDCDWRVFPSTAHFGESYEKIAKAYSKL
jgi:hypothetical protein